MGFQLANRLVYMLTCVVIAFVFLGGVAVANAGEVVTSEGFKPLLGVWTYKGTAFGQPAEINMTWSMVLDGKFARVDYRIAMTTKDGPRVFEGVGHYRVTTGSAYVGSWADNGGDLHRIVGTLAANTYTSIWGEVGAKRGKTQYQVQDDGRVEVVDWIELKDGSWKEFNRAVFAQQK